jgi:four helix bundle protein
MFDFQKLTVYIKAKQFHSNSKKLIKNKKLINPVADQLNRASFSVALNIAEGSGRFSQKDRRHFFVISRSSIFECVAILDILHDEKIVSEEEFGSFQKQADELSRILYAMIKNLS